VRIEWLPEAARNLTAQLGWVAEHDAWAAIDMGDAIHAAVRRLASHPAFGRPGRVDGTRELVVVGTPYVVVYRIEASAVVILRVLHGAQRWPPLRGGR
jgi:toxin ParE1/3/4